MQRLGPGGKRNGGTSCSKLHVFTGIGIIADQRINEVIEIDVAHRLRRHPGRTRIIDPLAHQPGHAVQILGQLVAQLRLVSHLHPQPHPGNRRL